jgi:hypothetical protein
MKTINIRIPFIVAFFLMTLAAGAQDYAFKVLVNKGNNEVKTGNTWQPIKTGASLGASDELKLSDNAYIGLVHNNGKPLEIKQAGNYKVADLSNKVGTGASVLSKYTDFILSSNSAEAKKNRLSATGAVHRGDPTAIQVLLPENQFSGIYNATAMVSWESTKTEGPFVVIVNNMFGEELLKLETPENSIQLDLADKKLASENAVLVQVFAKADPSKKSAEKLIKKLSATEKEKIKLAMGEISGDVASENALNKYILAGFYEKNNLFIDAVGAYEAAIKLAPDVTMYKESYDDFLFRHSMKK